LPALVLARAEEKERAIDGRGIEALREERRSVVPLLDVELEDAIEHRVRRKRVLVLLIRAKLRGRGLLDRGDRDALAVLVDEPREAPHQRLRDVADHRQTAAHVAVQGRVPDGELALVSGGEQDGAGAIRDGHQGGPADPCLHVLQRRVGGGRRGERVEVRSELAEVRREHRLDRDLAEPDPEISGQRRRVGA
jgi:hypothetical protein